MHKHVQEHKDFKPIIKKRYQPSTQIHKHNEDLTSKRKKNIEYKQSSITIIFKKSTKINLRIET